MATVLSSPWLHTAIGLLGGRLIGWWIAWRLFVQAGRELHDEAAELRRLSELLLHGMENAGWIRVTRNAQGRMVQLVVLHGAITAPASTVQGTITVRPPPAPSPHAPLTLRKVGVKAKRFRRKKQLTQAALAERVGVHRIYIAQIEAGTKTPSLATLAKLAKALGVPVTALLE